MKQTLLDELAFQRNHKSLSDLKEETSMQEFYICILAIPFDKYPLEEWIECVDYLLGKKHDITTEREARKCFADEFYKRQPKLQKETNKENTTN